MPAVPRDVPAWRPDAILKKRVSDNSDSLDKAGDGKPLSRAFSREYRLLKAAEFSRVFSAAQRSSDRYFTVLARVSPATVSSSRLGLAIAKKQLRRSVDRNRIKRLVREYFRTRVRPESGRPLDFVVMARKAVTGADNDRLRESLAGHFRKICRQSDDRNDTDQSVA